MTALPLLLCALAFGFEDQGSPLASSAMAEKRYGVLLLAEGGDKDWKDTVEDVRKAMFKKSRPFDVALGQGDVKAMQKAVDHLQFQRVKKIVVVPLILSSYSDEMDEDRYLLGVREKPSLEFSSAPHSHNRAAGAQERVEAKVPVVVAKGLDDSDELVDILADRAKALSHEPGKEVLMLVGKAPSSAEARKDWISTTKGLSEKVRAKGGFAIAQPAALRDDVDRAARDDSEMQVRRAVNGLHHLGPVVIVPLELAPDLVHSRMPHVLEGAQARYDGKTILPDPRIVKWVENSAQAGAALPEMRVFKTGLEGPALKQKTSQFGGSQLSNDSQLKSPGGY